MNDVGAKISRFDATHAVRIVQPKLAVDPPSGAVVLAAGATVTIYDDQASAYMLEYLHIQNLGTGSVKYAINDDATANTFHEILPGGLADDDGLGGSAEFNNFNIKKFTVFSAAGSRLGVVIGKNPFRPTQPMPVAGP